MKPKELNLGKKNVEKAPIQSRSLESSSRLKTLDLSVPEKIKKKSKRRKKLLTIFFIFVLILGIFSGAIYYFIYTPVQRVIDRADNIKLTLFSLISDIQEKDISNIDIYLTNIKKDIATINNEIDRFDFLQNLEQTKGYYDNFQQAQVILNKTDSLVTETLPELKDLLELSGFKVEETLIEDEETEDGAIIMILKNLPQYINLYNSIEPKVIDIFNEVEKLNPEYIPSFADFDIKDNLEDFKKFSKEFPELSEKTINFIKEIPTFIGSNSETTYLVILQNETEMRSSGGLLTAFGTIKVSNGEIDDDISLTDTWQLQYDMWRIGLPMPRNNIYGQSYLMNSGCGATEARVQDVGLYPDLNISIGYFQEYYDRVRRYFPEKYPAYDQTIILNYNFSENLLELVQPLVIEGFGEVNAENLYNFIKEETDNPAIFFDDDRKGILKTLAKEAKDKLLGLGLSEIPNVINLIVSSFQAKDIALYSKDKRVQEYFDTYGMSGRSSKDFDGDYFQFNEAQNCALKLNKFIRDTVDLSVNISDDGSINNSLKVRWQNPQIYNESLILQYSPTLQFSYRAWVRFMLPQGSSNIVSDGYSRSGYLYYFPKNYFDSEMQKQVSDNIIQFDHRRFVESDPIERDEMNVSWNLPNSINYNSDGRYKLLIQKHPGKSWGEKYTININHNGSSNSINFILDRDKVLTYKDGILSLENYDKSLDWLTQLTSRIPWGEITSNDSGEEN